MSPGTQETRMSSAGAVAGAPPPPGVSSSPMSGSGSSSTEECWPCAPPLPTSGRSCGKCSRGSSPTARRHRGGEVRPCPGAISGRH